MGNEQEDYENRKAEYNREVAERRQGRRQSRHTCGVCGGAGCHSALSPANAMRGSRIARVPCGACNGRGWVIG